jgi:hypothetical protein
MLIFAFLACVSLSHAIDLSSPTQFCQTRSFLPRVEYYISSNFIWFPSSVTSTDILQQAQSSHTELRTTAHPIPGTIIESTISNFLNSPCTLHLKIDVTGYASAQQSLILLNGTLGTTDLMCRLATYKLGRRYEENVHIMLPSQLKASISFPGWINPGWTNPGWINPSWINPSWINPSWIKREAARDSSVRNEHGHIHTRTLPKNESQNSRVPQHHLMRRLPPSSGHQYSKHEILSSKSQFAPPPAGFEYNVECPQSVQPAYSEAEVAEIIGARDGLALMKDCKWCQKVVGEMREICSETKADGVGELASIISDSGWSFGGSTCQEC